MKKHILQHKRHLFANILLELKGKIHLVTFTLSQLCMNFTNYAIATVFALHPMYKDPPFIPKQTIDQGLLV